MTPHERAEQGERRERDAEPGEHHPPHERELIGVDAPPRRDLLLAARAGDR